MSDLISKSKLLNEMENSLPFRMHANGMERAVEMVKNAGTVDAAPRAPGRWDETCKCTACGKECSVVFKPFESSHQSTKVYIMSLYCPNCGAKMRLEDDHAR